MKQTLFLAIAFQLFLLSPKVSSTLLPLTQIEKTYVELGVRDGSAIVFAPSSAIGLGAPWEPVPPRGINPNHLLQEAPAYATGANPISAAMGDFNGDGNEDVVTANLSGNNVSVLLGNDDGTFRPPVNYATQIAPSSVAVGDFNSDGNLDIVVTNICGSDKTCRSKGTVSVLLGNGDGTFQAHKDYGVAAFQPYSVAVGDFNGDHKLDLAIANFCGDDPTCQRGPGNVSILLGKGDGTFQASMKFIVGNSPDSIGVADFDGDGKLDLAIANNLDNTVSILLGKGDGTFRRHVEYATGPIVSSVAVGDFNGDGKVDLAVADSAGGAAQASEVSVLLGTGMAPSRRTRTMQPEPTHFLSRSRI